MKKLSLFLVLLSVAFVACKNSKEKAQLVLEKKPNVIFIIADDMNGYGLNKQNPLVKSPYLDKFKSESINFINAACNTPVCNPSRSSFFSGLHPHTTGAYVNGSDGWNRSEILSKIRNLPEHFNDQGYETWGAGKLFHNKMGKDREPGIWDNYPVFKGGFGPHPTEEYWDGGNKFQSIKAWDDPDTDFPDVVNANAAIEFLNKDHEDPFLMVYGLWRPHSPYTAPKRFFNMYNEEDFYLPEGYKADDFDDVPYLGQMLVDSLNKYRKNEKGLEKTWKRFLYGYAANYSFTDWNIGRVVEALDNSKYAENTIIVLISDNGFHNGEKLRWGKSTLWEQADYVPFLIRTPDKKEAESKATVSLIDIFPTLVDYCGINKPQHKLDGNSLMPIIENPNLKWDKPSFTSYGIEYSSVRNERYRYLRYPDGSEELYDHETDPNEWTNIASRSENEAIKKELSQYIPKDWAPSLGGRLEVPRDFDKVMRPSMKAAPRANGS